jgi:hypothetical protein
MEKTKDRTPEDNTAYATKQYWDQRYEQCVFPSIFFEIKLNLAIAPIKL